MNQTEKHIGNFKHFTMLEVNFCLTAFPCGIPIYFYMDRRTICVFLVKNYTVSAEILCAIQRFVNSPVQAAIGFARMLFGNAEARCNCSGNRMPGLFHFPADSFRNPIRPGNIGLRQQSSEFFSAQTNQNIRLACALS